MLLSSKGEWNGTKIPRLRVESVEDGKELKEDEIEENEVIQLEKERIGRLRKTWKKSKQSKRKEESEVP